MKFLKSISHKLWPIINNERPLSKIFKVYFREMKDLLFKVIFVAYISFREKRHIHIPMNNNNKSIESYRHEAHNRSITATEVDECLKCAAPNGLLARLIS